ncbi:hypothetical protein BAU15_15070 [Enterococcus sp. JM4C]|nr:hypothetical protein BAU15_15070 [Enterococcus sp. JM4C]
MKHILAQIHQFLLTSKIKPQSKGTLLVCACVILIVQLLSQVYTKSFFSLKDSLITLCIVLVIYFILPKKSNN